MKTSASDASLKIIHVNGRLHPELTLTLTDYYTDNVTAPFEELRQAIDKGKKLSVTVEPEKRRRSLDANNYCWQIITKIAEAIRSTKEEVYRKLVHDVGQFEIVPIRTDAVSEFVRMWSGRGLGWFAEVEGDSKLDGYSRVVTYFGSSVYDTRQMSILIDEVVIQAKELGIETLPPVEIEAMKNLWEVRHGDS